MALFFVLMVGYGDGRSCTARECAGGLNAALAARNMRELDEDVLVLGLCHCGTVMRELNAAARVWVR